MVQKVFLYTKTIIGTWWSTHVIYHLVKKPLYLVKNYPNRLYGWENLPLSSIFRPFWGLFNASEIQIGFKIGSQIVKWLFECGDQLTLSSIWPKEHYFWSKTTPKKKVQKIQLQQKSHNFFYVSNEKKIIQDWLKTYFV